jgi:hypothetical protein
VHRAGAALGDAASEFGAGEADCVTERPEEGGARLDIDLMLCSIDLKRDHPQAPIFMESARILAQQPASATGPKAHELARL